MRYKVIFHVGKELTVQTRVSSGTLTLQNEVISIAGSSPLTIPVSDITNVELFLLHGLGRMIKLICKERTIFLTVVRINLFGYFVIINFLKAGKLYQEFKRLLPESTSVVCETSSPN